MILVVSAPRPVANKQTQTNRDGKRPVDRKSSRAPFLPYGYEDNVKDIGKKQTHNVRAAREVNEFRIWFSNFTSIYVFSVNLM